MKGLYRDRHSKRGYHDFIKFALGVLVSLLVLTLFSFDILERFELTTFDYLMRLRPKRYGSEEIVLIDIAEDSINKIGRWPWPREWHATMIAALSSLGAKAVAFDILFSESSGGIGDDAMEEAIKGSGRVYLPHAFEFEERGQDDKKQRIWNAITPIDRFSKWAETGIHISIMQDRDGTIRRVPLFIDHAGKTYPQLGLKVACDAKGIDSSAYKVKNTPFGRYLNIGRGAKALNIPVDQNGRMLINWVGRWGEDFKHYSFFEVLNYYQEVQEGKIEPVDNDLFKDKVCIIGLTAAGLHDIKPNPLQPAYPAVGVNANIASNILDGDFIRKAPRWIDALLIMILGFFLSTHIYKLEPIKGIATTILMSVAYVLFSFVALDKMRISLSVIYPIITIISVYSIVNAYNQILIITERNRLIDLATKDSLTNLYVRRHFNLLLEAQIQMVKERVGNLSLLMIDVDNFKKVNDTYGHEAGDVILKETGKIFISSCRPLDIIARYGGEEFTVMLPGADANDAGLVAERIRDKIEKADFNLKEVIYKITVSIGIASYRRGDTIESFMERADGALYKAKERGKNSIFSSALLE